MTSIALRQLVRERARRRCEYCRLREDDQSSLRFHLEHIVAQQHGGGDEPENLAWSCHHCNLHKGTNLSAVDPESGQVVRVFNPRVNVWEEHFESRGPLVIGLTETGRATVRLLHMNEPRRVRLRSEI